MPVLKRFGEAWNAIPEKQYKDEPGSWQAVARRVLVESPTLAFQTRYFEVGPGGYTSFEKHCHEHVVVVVEGVGRVRLGDAWHPIAPGDVVHVLPNEPHQFRNDGDGRLGFVCIVDAIRDRPTLLRDTEPADERQ
ncbi:MAG: hypothetical protein AKCLJLPJ_01673 [Fimbriimonadales bacterium]|nr:MAG: cupin domain-containing protein [Armatimonadota bacterium]MBV6503592.1 hypothetical protein [Fimbriimonadales bacterium]MCE7900690.1 cupin domain-containing protein [Armatimonadetes bacterium ATM1]MDL1928570.1 cupin domain-containing protein [Fimbriimonadia bacterium ATM]MBC6970052.1 cupin domain-containing protein [Armatimonadota bacterium]